MNVVDPHYLDSVAFGHGLNPGLNPILDLGKNIRGRRHSVCSPQV